MRAVWDSKRLVSALLYRKLVRLPGKEAVLAGINNEAEAADDDDDADGAAADAAAHAGADAGADADDDDDDDDQHHHDGDWEDDDDDGHDDGHDDDDVDGDDDADDEIRCRAQGLGCQVSDGDNHRRPCHDDGMPTTTAAANTEWLSN